LILFSEFNKGVPLRTADGREACFKPGPATAISATGSVKALIEFANPPEQGGQCQFKITGARQLQGNQDERLSAEWNMDVYLPPPLFTPLVAPVAQIVAGVRASGVRIVVIVILPLL
jgi:hypothetical protein